MPHQSRFLCVIAGALAISLAFMPGLARAQNFSPKAIVNDEIITGYDVAQRTLLLNAAGGAASVGPEQALESLIEDVLRVQAAQRSGIEPTPEEIRSGFEEISKINKRDPNEVRTFFRSRGITDEAINSQIKAEVAWRRLIRQRYASRVRISESDIDAAIAEQGTGAVRYRLAQLVVPLAANAPEAQADQAFSQAQQLRSQLTSCQDIMARRAQYHPISGDVGVMTAQQMPKAVREAVAGLDAGQMANPVRSNDGMHVIMVCDKAGGGAGAASEKDRQRVMLALQGKKLERYSRSLLRELRREAIIDRK